MITAFAISVAAIVAFAAGYYAGDSIRRVLAILIGGVAVMVAVFTVAIVLPNPGGDGWVNRVLVAGHWVPGWEWNLAFWSVAAWFFAVWAAWLTREAVLDRSRHQAS